jgi:hypothetical protein
MRTPAGWVLRKELYDIKEKPGEPDVWERLKRAGTVAQVRNACRASRVWLNPRVTQKPWVADLHEHASEFLAGTEYRYPKSKRPSSEKKRIVHFARVMAGITVGISAARAIDLLRNMKHGANCDCVSCSVENVKNPKNYRGTVSRAHGRKLVHGEYPFPLKS